MMLLLMVLAFLQKPAHSLDLARRRLAFSVAGGDCSSPLCTHAERLISPLTQLRSLEVGRTTHRIVQSNKYAPSPRNGHASTTSSLTLYRGGAADSPDAKSHVTPKSSDVLSYYLLWSPGIFRKTVLCTIPLFVLRLASVPFQSQLAGMLVKASPNSSSLRFFLQVVLLPILSSACCGIQLAINVLVGAGGCAGFNKYLGPLRPCFLSVLFVTTATTFPAKTTAIVHWFQYSLFRWTVALMPEIVHVWNNYVAKRTRKRHEGRDGSVAHYTTMELTIPTMGCVACINKVDSSIRNCAPDKITDATSWLEPSEKGGRALVRAVVSTKEEAESLANTVAKSVQAAGFEPCIVESIHTRDP